MTKLNDLSPELHVNIARHVVPLLELKECNPVQKIGQADEQDVYSLAKVSPYWQEICTIAMKQQRKTAEEALQAVKAEFEDLLTSRRNLLLLSWLYIMLEDWKKYVPFLENLQSVLDKLHEHEKTSKQE